MNETALLHRLIEQQAADRPDAVAVTGDDAELSYGRLDDQANRLAHRLIRSGAGPETAVAVLAARSSDTVVALLAVLKAGAAYVPVDPANPPERVSYLMRDSGATVLVAPQRLAATAPTGPWTTVTFDAGPAAGEPAGPVPDRAGPDNAAYLIYTSGSTGQPKGVVVPHRQIVRSTLAHQEFGRPEPSCFLLLISFAFDACAVGLYWTLTTGGRVVIPSTDDLRDPLALRTLAAKHQITHLDCTPTLYSLMLADAPEPLSTLRCAIVGGEACPADLVERHHRLLPDCLLVNNYGPTETTVWATSATVTPANGAVSIGAAIPGVRTYVLDEELRSLAEGTEGELFIGGETVARGYHGRPGLTAERFLPDPFSTRGERMYRTGDRVRRLPAGELEFRGRFDHQVKVRGFRIELGEVESALTAHPDVVEAVADVRDAGGTATLVAWARSTGAGTGEILQHLRDRLPAHMVPSRLMLLDALPRNVAGKVDRGRLPDPTAPAGAAGTEPTTPLEAEVAELAAEVLGLPVGRTDNFFDLGATSLHLSRLLLGVMSRFQVSVPTHQLFRVPSVLGVAQLIEAARRLDDRDATGTWTPEQLAAAGELDGDIRPDGLAPSTWFDPRHVFVTGATGYLGAYLVKELAQRTDATLWCLVRAASEDEAIERIRAAMSGYLIWDDAYLSRIRPVVGDLAEPRFGLSEAAYERLGRDIDVIYHSGAVANFMYPYSAIKRTNVDGTAEVLRLATTGTLKAVHHVSTIDVLVGTGIERPYREDVEMIARTVPEGYARSKWVAEAFAREARDRGVPCSIYRPGLIFSHTETGATQLNDYLLVEIKGLLDFGIVPDIEYRLPVSTVDYVSRAIAHISAQEHCLGGTYHLWDPDPVPVASIFSWIRSFGYTFDPVPFETVIKRLAELDPSSPVLPLLPLFLDEERRLRTESFEPDVLAAADRQVECARTLAAVEGTGIGSAPMSEELAHRCFQYLVDVGFFPEPATQRAQLAAREQVVEWREREHVG
ncbi:amino acid adenylation domain-containing protein [Micromonospora sp. NPDC050686]|uniref:non-ribosomal peptide synthetase family protein n=1 Tax=Micromonospora sp. NPDC050686 TaxID=3154631 RepID=UPI00340C0D45